MFISTGINESPVITGKATAAITGGAFLAVKFDANGGIVLAAAGGNALGVLIASTPDNVAAGEDVTVQIKDIGLWKSGAAVAAGAEVTADVTGRAVAAVAGNYITAITLEPATAANQIIRVQIVKNGAKPAMTLDELTDVTISAPADAQSLKYNAATSQWKNLI